MTITEPNIKFNEQTGKYESVWPFQFVTVDIIAYNLSLRKILLITRGIEPWKGSLALPGGHVQSGEDLAESAVRELKEETGIDLHPSDVIQFRTYGHPNMDPRGHYITVTYGVNLDMSFEIRAGDDAATVRWYSLDDLEKFNLVPHHKQIIREFWYG